VRPVTRTHRGAAVALAAGDKGSERRPVSVNDRLWRRAFQETGDSRDATTAGPRDGIRPIPRRKPLHQKLGFLRRLGATRCIVTPVSPKIRFNFWLEAEQRDGLRLLKERDGIPESEQVRRAIASWLESKGVARKAARPRALTRERA
jgi:hypothetical protein